MNPLPEYIQGEYPFTPKSIELHSAASMSYLDEGEGRAIVMLHGNPSWSFLYRNLVKRLAPNRRCIVPDHIGCGFSEKPETYTYRLRQHIDNIVDLIQKLDIAEFDLALHDWGGTIGMGLAERMPERVGRIIAMNTAAFRASWIPFRINICRIPGFGSWVIRGCNGFAGPASKMAVSQPMTKEVRDGFIFPYGNWQDRVATWAFVQDIPMTPFHPTWDTLVKVEKGLSQFKDRKVLLLWGMKDFCFHKKFLKRWSEFFPEAEVVKYGKAGHYVLEDAGEDALDRIEAFLSDDGYGAASYFDRLSALSLSQGPEQQP